MNELITTVRSKLYLIEYDLPNIMEDLILKGYRGMIFHLYCGTYKTTQNKYEKEIDSDSIKELMKNDTLRIKNRGYYFNIQHSSGGTFVGRNDIHGNYSIEFSISINEKFQWWYRGMYVAYTFTNQDIQRLRLNKYERILAMVHMFLKYNIYAPHLVNEIINF